MPDDFLSIERRLGNYAMVLAGSAGILTIVYCLNFIYGDTETISLITMFSAVLIYPIIHTFKLQRRLNRLINIDLQGEK